MADELGGQMGDGTRCVHAGSAGSPGEPVAPQPVLASQFYLGGEIGYGREDNPTWRGLESALGELDGGSAVLFSSGMAAVAALLSTVLRPGDTLVLPSDGYYGIRAHVREDVAPRGVTVREVPTAATGDYTGARLVLIETPSNPGLDVCDIAAAASSAHAAGALLAVDNTTATPLGQSPLALGADVVISSDTKATSGHSDVLLGHLSTRDSALADRFRAARTRSGAIAGPFEAWLAHRGLSTLDLRLRRQEDNARALAKALVEHPAVRNLRWPGLPEDPAFSLAQRQMRRLPGVLCFELASADAVDAFLARSALVAAATSFGGVHSSADRRAQWGDAVPPGFVRFSCGIEDTQDLVADVLSALDHPAV